MFRSSLDSPNYSLFDDESAAQQSDLIPASLQESYDSLQHTPPTQNSLHAHKNKFIVRRELTQNASLSLQ